MTNMNVLDVAVTLSIRTELAEVDVEMVVEMTVGNPVTVGTATVVYFNAGARQQNPISFPLY